MGDIGVAVPVTVYDNGRHYNPVVHEHPFDATLLFIPGALLRSGGQYTHVDWNEVIKHDELIPDFYVFDENYQGQ